jgi:hypothetical protein
MRLGLIKTGHGNNGLALKRAADVRAEALAPTIRKLRKAGFVSVSAIVRELNKRQVPTARIVIDSTGRKAALAAMSARDTT